MSKHSVIWEFKRYDVKNEPFYSDRFANASEMLGKYLESMCVGLTEWYDNASQQGYLRVQFLEACSQSERDRILEPIHKKWVSGGYIPASATRIIKYVEDLGEGWSATQKEAPSKLLDIVAQKVKQAQAQQGGVVVP